MTKSSNLILVTGATGKLGRILTSTLTADGLAVRVLTRRPDAARDLFGDSVEIVEGDFAKPETLPAAVAGVSRALLLSPISEHMAAEQIALIDAAKAAAVTRIVKISGSDWTVGTSFSGDAHKEIEDHLAVSGLEYVAIRPNAWLQVALNATVEQIGRGEPLYARHGNARVGYVDVRDIADVAINQLLAHAITPGPLVITGPDALTLSDIAAIATRVGGKPVSITTTPPAPLHSHGDGFEAKVVQQFFQVISKGGAAGLTGTVSAVLGRPPRSVEAFLIERLANLL